MIDTILNLIVFAFIGFLLYLFLRDEDPGGASDDNEL